jgi:hypothetical protein
MKPLSRWVLTGFVCGALSVLLFHQGAAALLHALEITPRAPYSMQPVGPWAVPQIVSISFWGGVWGALLAATFGRMEGVGLLVGAAIFGAVLPTLVAWFLVAPMKGLPVRFSLIGPLLNGLWGLGTAIGLMLFGRRRRG